MIAGAQHQDRDLRDAKQVSLDRTRVGDPHRSGKGRRILMIDMG